MSTPKGPFDIIVIGAGPSGAVASALLNKQGYNVLVVEKEHFPRFSIGESLLPQCMTFLEQADMLEAVQEAAFQHKNGAAFAYGDQYNFFDFREKFSEGWGTTFQVQRDRFDKILADQAEKQGVTICYGHMVTAFEPGPDKVQLSVQTDQGESYDISAKFALDASGFGRVLPRLLDLNLPSELAVRTSFFTHVEDNITDERHDREKILATVHPGHRDVWYWLIPFSNGRSSIGAVVPEGFFSGDSRDRESKLKGLVAESGLMNEILKNAKFDTDVLETGGYSCRVKQLYGDGFALLGNAGEFLDPVFSSGVTIALKSASLAAAAVDRQLSGLQPDWDVEYAAPLMVGVDTFREFVEGWYDERFQDIAFSDIKNENVTGMISSILAGYAWDQKNPYVDKPSRLNTLAEICRG